SRYRDNIYLHSFPTRRSSDLPGKMYFTQEDIDKFEKYRYSFDDFLLKGELDVPYEIFNLYRRRWLERNDFISEVLKNPKLQDFRSEEHTSELQSRENLVCRLL